VRPLHATILAASIWGPGLPGWASSRTVLAGQHPYAPTPTPAPPPALLPATERRRAGPVVRLALAVAHEAAAASGLPPETLRAVFASSNGDGPVVGAILDALATSCANERVVSPTQFHNSVHNAAAGYWSIATASRLPATCIGCNDDSWAAGLLIALAELHATCAPVLLCCYDHPLPAPLYAVRPTGPAFAAALVLAPNGAGPTLALQHDPQAPPRDHPQLPADLDVLMRQNPAARALPLLAQIARNQPGAHDLPYLEGRLTLSLQP